LKIAWLLALAAVSACGAPPSKTGEADGDAPMPSGHRAVAFSTCCRVPVPFDATAALPGNLVDSEIMQIERPGLAMKFEYVRAGEPERPLVEGSRSDVTIDGVPAVLRLLPPKGPQRILHLSLALPAEGSVQPMGRALTVRAQCTSDADCAAAKQIIEGLRWLPVDGEPR